MLYLGNRDVAQILRPRELHRGPGRGVSRPRPGRATSRPRTDVFTPCERADGYHRWASMDGSIEPWGIFASRMKSDIVTWTEDGTEEVHCVRPGTFSGFIMVFSTRNGEPLAIMNDGAFHHLRVAAGAALGVKYLAREDAAVVGMLGSGGMARAYLAAFREVRSIAKVKVYSPTKAHREAFAGEMSRQLGVPVQPYERPEPVVRGADIVATCTDSTKLVITDLSWLEKGVHVANLSAREIAWEVVRRCCDRVVQIGTETLGPSANEQAEREYYGWATWMIGRPEEVARIPKHPVSNVDFLKYSTLVDILNDPSKRRTSPEQITFFHNLGLLGFQFAAVAARVYTLAKEAGLGTPIGTEPFLQNIRD